MSDGSIGRVVRPHFCGVGEQLLVDDLTLLRPAERLALPPATRALFDRARRVAREVPEELGWAKGELSVRRPVLERATIDGRVYWSARFARYEALAQLEKPCFGADGVAAAGSLPAPLDWLASIGTCSLVAEQSGTAPWGRPLREYREQRALLAFGDTPAPELPAGSDDWVCLYEVDGDAIFADLASGAAYWLGFEWTGELLRPLDGGWRAVMHFVLWRMLDGGWVRPSDLRMLAAVRR